MHRCDGPGAHFDIACAPRGEAAQRDVLCGAGPTFAGLLVNFAHDTDRNRYCTLNATAESLTCPHLCQIIVNFSIFVDALTTRLTGLAPKGVRKLLFNWSKSFNDIHGMARARGCSLPHDGSLAVPMAAHIIAAVATAQAEGDQNERDTVLKFIKTSALKIINAVFALKTGDVNDFNFPSAPDAVPQLLQAIGALRDVSTAPETPAEFSVYADRLALAACALAGLCLAAAAGPTRIDQLRVLCSSDFTECILMASQSWIHLLRCCRDAPGLEFWDIAGDVVHILGRFINAAVSITEHVTTASGHLRDMTSVSEADELSSVVAASPASVVRALAVLAAAMPEVLDLPDGTSVRTTNSVLLGRLMFGRLPDAAIGYSIMDDFYREDFKFASLETERAIHACLNTMLCLQVAPGPWRALRTDTELGAMAASSPQDAVPGFFAACTMLHWDLNALKNFSKSPKHAESDLGGEASVFAAIHGLAAAAGLSEAQMKDTASRFVHVGLLDTPLDLLRSVLVPVDADGLRKLLLCNDLVPGDSEALQALIKVAIDSEGLEERHKGRLQLLERLPEGVCANLRCSEPLTAVGKLRKCSGCLIVRYCCAKCSKIDWKHGHKVACQAVQRERSGGG